MEKKFSLYSIVLRHLVFKVTPNLQRIYLDIDLELNIMLLTAYYLSPPTELELELLDDIATNTNAPIPDFLVDYKVQLMSNYLENEKHDFVVFAVYYDYE